MQQGKKGGLVVGSYKVGSPIYWHTTSLTGAKSSPENPRKKDFGVFSHRKGPGEEENQYIDFKYIEDSLAISGSSRLVTLLFHHNIYIYVYV